MPCYLTHVLYAYVMLFPKLKMPKLLSPIRHTSPFQQQDLHPSREKARIQKMKIKIRIEKEEEEVEGEKNEKKNNKKTNSNNDEDDKKQKRRRVVGIKKNQSRNWSNQPKAALKPANVHPPPSLD